MLRFHPMFLAGAVVAASCAFAGAQATPSGLPNTPPGNKPALGSSSATAGRGSADTTPPAGVTGAAASSTSNPPASGTAATGSSNPTGSASNSAAGSTGNSTTSGKTSSGTEAATSSTSTPPATPAVAPPVPTTTMLPGANGQKDPTDVTDLLAPGELPKDKLSLVGGTVKKIDQIADRIVVKIYGGGTMKVAFDQRTRFFRDGREVTQMAIKPGDRVYLDTQLDKDQRIFAKNIHLQTTSSPADASGQIVAYNPRSGIMTLQDDLSSRPVRFRVAPSTSIVSQGKKTPSASVGSDLRPGALVAVKFSPMQQGGAVAEQVSIIAEPGNSFTFFGHITHLDLRNGLLAIENQTDGKTYEISFDSSRTPVSDQLTVGSEATIVATFEGNGYTAQTINIVAGQQAQSGSPQ